MSTFLPHIGLDIGSQTIKAVILSRKKDQWAILGFGKIPTPGKGLASETKEEIAEVSTAISKLIKDFKINIKEVTIGLPESQIFTRVIEMPIMTETEMASAVKWEAEQYIPIPLSEVSMDFTILEKYEADNKMSVLLVAAPLSLIEKYKHIISGADLTLSAIETETTSLSRAFMDTEDLAPVTVIVDIGGGSSCMAIVKKGSLAFTRSISVGGINLTRAVAQNLSISEQQAENYKITYGLEKDKLDGKVREAILPIIEILTSELKRGINAYQTKDKDNPVQRIVLAGGTCLLPDLVVYLTEETGIETQVGNPGFPEIGIDAPHFSLAVGLAKREEE